MVRLKQYVRVSLSDSPICNTTNYRLQLLNIMPSLRESAGESNQEEGLV